MKENDQRANSPSVSITEYFVPVLFYHMFVFNSLFELLTFTLCTLQTHYVTITLFLCMACVLQCIYNDYIQMLGICTTDYCVIY
ncbi:hypothetical protein SKAU_G00008220 [Synaphobranchus kaupii]|uniref:Uncharacterized protein n=1 Tax=Synaphobranchus kaupii TaxID=118154 RepID=A0A9Q1G9G2_SYNKA|nr:hypothetical protein SKAU_G00008220 [Synaphobranchus kaupii]